MLVAKVETLQPTVNGCFRVLSHRKVAARTVGEALDHKAPDPREGAVFRVTVVAQDVAEAGS